MSNFDRHAFVEALEQTKNHVPYPNTMDKLVDILVDRGFCVSRQADAWRRVTRPGENFMVQLELGEVIQRDTLFCIALNERVPENKFFSLYSIEHDWVEVENTTENTQLAADVVIDFYDASFKAFREMEEARS